MWVNTHGHFGHEGMFIAHNIRLIKSHVLHQLPQSKPPNAYILGSSNTLPFKTEDFDRTFNVNSFNLGTFFGKAVETYAFLTDLINERQIKPDLILIGIDPWTFTLDIAGPKFLPKMSTDIANAPILSKHLPQFSTLELWLSNFIALFSWQSLEHTLRAMKAYKMQRQNIHTGWQNFTDKGNFKPYIEENPSPYFRDEVHRYYSYLDRQNKLDQPWENERHRLVKETLMPPHMIRN